MLNDSSPFAANVNETLPPIQNTIASAEVLELSIDLVTPEAFQLVSSSVSSNSALLPLPFNSTEYSISTRLGNAANAFRNIGLQQSKHWPLKQFALFTYDLLIIKSFRLIPASSESNENENTLVASPRKSIPSYYRFENNKENHGYQINSTSVEWSSPDADEVSSTSKENEFSCNVRMRVADLNRLMQKGHIFYQEGQFHYK